MSAEYLRIDNEIIALQAEIKKIEARVAALKTKLSAERKKILDEYENDGVIPDKPLYVRKVAPKLIVTDESRIPQKFFKTQKVLMKEALNKAHQSGEKIDGVALDNGGLTLAIRG